MVKFLLGLCLESVDHVFLDVDEMSIYNIMRCYYSLGGRCIMELSICIGCYEFLVIGHPDVRWFDYGTKTR